MKSLVLLFATTLLLLSGLKSQESSNISLIPQPVSVARGTGFYQLKDPLIISAPPQNDSVKFVANFLSNRLVNTKGGWVSTEFSESAGKAPIRLQLLPKEDNEIGKEGYHLSVSEENGVLITANTSTGLFYGVQTLLQLLPTAAAGHTVVEGVQWQIPAVTIKDYPRFKWRGMLMDVARHFFTKEQVKQFIDNMATFKFNMLHLHLSDDQAWRVEIKRLPRLTEVGAWRAERTGRWGEFTKPSPDEPKTYGGFYTHDDIKELVKYAAERNVTILPEIDVPGHSLAAIAAYPNLTCTPGTYQVSSGERIMVWDKGTFYALQDNNLCPINERVYSFLDTVFTEIAELFPFQYIHMGGDECYKGFWEKNKQVQAFMKKQGLKDANELQSYFVKRVEKIIQSKGKRLMGWDEILHGGLPPDATVMSWQGMKGGIEAAKQGHQVVMSPNSYAYLDLYQGDPIAEPPTYSMVRLSKAYEFDPMPPGVDSSLILGGQCNLWAERLHTMRHAEYMLWPRALAISESIWSQPAAKNWNSFISKVEHQFNRFDAASINYSRSMYDPIFKAGKDSNDSLQITLSTEIEGLDIFYSFDEMFPDQFYPKYTTPLSVPKGAANLRVVTYRNGKPVGKQIKMPVIELKKRAGIKVKETP
ncbi:beta-N-acetylhexosaminidase [Filimonas effusa]|uniref:beta-N-acetylhexosaminidase n=1 Tax=Filimonas effusa TaxID=2508721 RepID=A0A4Q1D746_9BACT|nr:family 20 glycosylhydrolase [Filimonas effusa]RXK83753.1 beta-N-acetylhexosaminidase [Filimonas effusa]